MNANQASLFSKVMVGLLLALLVMIPSVQSARADATVFGWWNALPAEPQLSADGLSMSGATHPPVMLLVDPNPPEDRPRVPPRDYPVQPETATANFQFTYVPNGQTDLFGEPCHTFPEAAKAAVERAGVIWGKILQSSVPITVRLCWMNQPGNVLGYSGGHPMQRDFSNAPRSNTWFQGSLANSLAGSNLDPNKFDMHIAMNGNFSWYLGLDANPPSNQIDFVTTMMHEIAHGLNFAGSMRVVSGQAQWGYGTDFPNIYDVNMRDGSGNQLINTSVYPNPSSALLSAVTSNDLWFQGTNAMAANSGQRVKMYAPSTWAGGSSYSHLDYATFSDSPHRLMVYNLSTGDAVHDPGTITIGLLKDLGWRIGSAATYTLTVNSSGASGVAITANPSTYGGTTNYSPSGIASGTSITLTAPATADGRDFSSWSGCGSTSNRDCTVSMTQDRTVTANYTPEGDVVPLTNGVPVTGLSGAQGSELFFSITVPTGATDLQVAMSSGTGDADLYVRFGVLPTQSDWECRPWLSGNNETCSFPTPTAGTYYMMLHGYLAYSGVTLVVSYTGVTTYALNVNSTGATGVSITANPSTYGGTTNYSRSGIASGTSITLTAPAITGSSSFTSWTGCDSTNQSARTCTVTMNSSKTVKAIYDRDTPSALPGVLMLLLDEE